MVEWTLTWNQDLHARWRMKQLRLFGLLAPFILAACTSSTPAALKSPRPVVVTPTVTSVLDPPDRPPSGWRRYTSTRAGYALYHPGNWMEIAGGGPEEDRGFAPIGADPYSGPVWLAVDAVPVEQIAQEGFPDCQHYNVAEGKYRFSGRYQIGGKNGFGFSSASFTGEPFFGMTVTVEAVGRCFRFDAFSDTPQNWKISSATIRRILSTVTFRP